MFIILSKIGSDPMTAATYPRCHKTFEEATTEAERLAEAEEKFGKSFHIFELVANTARAKGPVKTTWVGSQTVKSIVKKSRRA
jgi:hypothetical protein